MRLLSLAILLTGLSGASDPIISRHDVSDRAFIEFADELPVMSAVVRYNSTDVAGTLIAPDWILSAAHVAETITPGRKLLTSGGDSVEVKKVVLHPGWIEHGRPEDIALIELRTPVEDGPFIELYSGRDEVGNEIIIVGNGDHGTGLSGPVGNDGRMRAATNRIDGATDDYLTWIFDAPDSDRTTRLEGISGPGDSGGPAFIQDGSTYYLAGVSSAQSTRAAGDQEGRYGVTEYYSRVSTYRPWIETILSK